MRHKLERLALIPKNLRCFCDRRLGQTCHHVALLDRHRTRQRDHALIFVAKDNATNLRLKVGFILHKLLLQMPAGKFERDELMMIVRLARGRQRFVRNCVVAGITREIIAPRLASRADSSAAFEI